MTKRRILSFAFVCSVILLISGLAIVLSGNRWQSEPVQLRILDGEVGVYNGHDGKRLDSANGSYVDPGRYVKSAENSSGVLEYFEASAIKIDGMSEVHHLWSKRRTAHSDFFSRVKFYLSRLRQQVFGPANAAPPPGIGRSIALEVIYGKVTVSASRDYDPESLFELWFPGGVIVVQGAGFTANVDSERGVVIEAKYGTLQVSTAAQDTSSHAVITTTVLRAGEALAIPPLPGQWSADPSVYLKLMSAARQTAEKSIGTSKFELAFKGTRLSARNENGVGLYAVTGVPDYSGRPLTPPALPAGYQIVPDELLDQTNIVKGRTANIQLPVIPGERRQKNTPPLAVKREKPPFFGSSLEGFAQPMGIAVDRETGNFYVTESAGSRSARCFDRSGKPLFVLIPPGTLPGNRAPSYVAVDDRTGIVFVSDRARHLIDMFDAGGTYLGAFNPGGNLTASWSPLGLSCVNSYLYVTEVSDFEHRILVFDPASGELKTMFGKQGQEIGQFAFPGDAVADPKGQIYVADSNNFRIQVFDAAGQSIGDFSRWGQSDMGMPRGMDIEGNYLYVVDAFDQLVNVYSVETSVGLVFSFGKAGIGPGEFNFPNDVAFDPSGKIYVVDRKNNRVQVWRY